MSKQPSITRRQFLHLAAASAGSLAIAACVGPIAPAATPTATQTSPTITPPPPTVTETPPTITPMPPAATEALPTAVPTPLTYTPIPPKSPSWSRYKEAPLLAEKVMACELPPVDLRLPVDPRVVVPHKEIGQYGGTLRRSYVGWNDQENVAIWLEEKATRWIISPGPNGGEYECVPNYISGWTQNEDSTEFTFVLREGLRWSDGAPLTTADIQFFYDNFFITEIVTGDLDVARPGGTYLELEVTDELTYTFKFARPFVQLPLLLATQELGPLGGPTCAAPTHYLDQFIPPLSDYAQSFINRARGLGSGVTLEELFGEYIINPFFNPDLPVLMAWHTTNPLPNDPFTLERNPFYFAVDTAGNQLPYADKMRFDYISAWHWLDNQAAEGKIDYQYGPRLGHLRDEADLTVILWKTLGHQAFGFNESIEDDILRELFANRDFIQAANLVAKRYRNNVSTADDIDTRQISPPPCSKYYDPEWEARWTEYDPDTANALLDGLGLKVGTDGLRTHPDGQPLAIFVTRPDNGPREWGSIDWQAIGIDSWGGICDEWRHHEQRANNELVCYPQSLPHGVGPMTRPDLARGASFAPAYYAWYRQNILGQETKYTQIRPPDGHYIWELWDAVEEILRAPNAAAEETGWRRYFKLSKDNRALVGLWGSQPAAYVAHNRVGNIVENGIHDPVYRGEKVIGPEQLFLKYTLGDE